MIQLEGDNGRRGVFSLACGRARGLWAGGSGLTIEVRHVDGLGAYEPVALVQLAHEQLAAAEQVHQVILVERHARREVAAREQREARSENEKTRQRIKRTRCTTRAGGRERFNWKRLGFVRSMSASLWRQVASGARDR